MNEGPLPDGGGGERPKGWPPPPGADVPPSAEAAPPVQGGRAEQACADESFDELRIALAMTGGVSLAVWMGGVAYELNRMLHGQGPYGDMLSELRTRPRVDLIAGSSAGGLNGALLAAAIANDQDLHFLRGLWAREGSLDGLLRAPFDPDARSLLKGDAKFLPALEHAFEELVVHKSHPANPGLCDPGTPLQLTITTTLLEGQPGVYGDDFGSVLVSPSHRGEFVFEGAAAGGSGVGPPHFTGADAPARLAAARRLALAVRCSASFPFAFEPSYCPVGAGPRPSGAEDRVDMEPVARFRAQHTVDGGVLVNKPLGLVLEDIFAQHATSPVRRVLAYVNPLPEGRPAAPGSTEAPEVPPLTGVVTKSVVGLRGVESLTSHLEDLRSQNRQVRSRRETRDQLAVSLSRLSDDPAASLVGHARVLYESYRSSSTGRGIAHIFDCMFESGAAAQLAGDVYDLRELDRALRKADEATPWVPPPWPPGAGLPGTDAEGWSWGIHAVESAAAVVLQLVRRAQRLPGAGPDERATLQRSSAEVYAAISVLQRLKQLDRDHWPEQVGGAVPLLRDLANPDTDEEKRHEVVQRLERWAATAVGTWLQNERQSLAGAARRVASALVGARQAIVRVLDRRAGGTPTAETNTELSSLGATVEALAPEGVDPDRCLGQLLALEVVERALGSERRIPQAVELLQVSAEAPNAFAESVKPVDKLTGDQFFHFGAFYKRSWRYNDWLWGRLDGAARLAQMLLDPGQLRRVLEGQTGDVAQRSALALISALAVEKETDQDRRDYLRARWEAGSVGSELSYLDRDEWAPPSALPAATLAVTRRLQLEILCEELPYLEWARGLDAADEDERHRDTEEPPELDPLAPDQAVRAFTTSPVRQETMAGELGSRRLLSLASRAGVVTSSTLQHPRSGLGQARRLIRPIRGVMLTLYGLVLGITAASPAAAAAASIVVAATAATFTVYAATDRLTDLPSAVVLGLFALGVVVFLRWRPSRAFTFTLVGVAAVVVAVVLPSLVSNGDAAEDWVVALRPLLIAAVLLALFWVGGFRGLRSARRPKQGGRR